MSHYVTLLQALAFAAEKHKDHRRKDVNASPYINHLIAAVRILAEDGRVDDEDLLVAAILHDTVEDTETSFAEIEEYFGAKVAGIVREVTDDKSLKKAARKQLQVERAPVCSGQAKQLMIADKICNVLDVMHHPPNGWTVERRREYLAWTSRVVAGCRDVNPGLDRAYDEIVRKAAAHLDLPKGALADVVA